MQAELDSTSTLYTVHRFRNEFEMMLSNELFDQPLKLCKPQVVSTTEDLQNVRVSEHVNKKSYVKNSS